jgi:DNA topoisomerase-6 subunit B
MAKSANKTSSSKKNGEVQVSKSPAEFFAENQAIAGFDNMGKSLYTSIRELMENSLDACESIGQLPTISVAIEELTLKEFNQLRGISHTTKDTELFASKKKEKPAPGTSSTDPASAKKPRKKASQEAYFKIQVRDNGCGMKHEAIPDLLGRVLSGSKYGVRQTRGKFGLGAKMALIWSKKSTGAPIKITTSHRPKESSPTPPSHVSTCVLDIDISKNIPRIMEHKKQPNKDDWVGTQLELLIAGNWTTYKARIVQYLQQLAIITPYAQLELKYENLQEPQRNMSIRYDRRSEQMPPPGKEVKHHISSVNNLVIQQLLERTKHSLVSTFLIKDLAGLSLDTAKRLVVECGISEDVECEDLTDRQITQLVQKLRTCTKVKSPDGSCLSPLGEYNLNLGIRKVLEPDYIATARDKPSAYEGHPFVVEAAVSLGGKDAKEGITVVRFANRIPLLFEAGADVSTRVAQTKIRWSNYKMDHKRDKIGVFVSIVSTKIPYKGTGKEYIGDDITEISVSVKRALQTCCQQLRTHLAKRNALRDQKERRSRLTKYIPDVTRSLYGLLGQMGTRLQEEPPANPSPRKRPRADPSLAKDLVEQFEKGEITENLIKQRLEEAVNVSNSLLEEEHSAKEKKKNGIPLFLTPLFDMTNAANDIDHPLFTFRPIHTVSP